MKNYFAKSKQHILITVLAMLIIFCGLFVGCNNSTEETLSGNEVESQVTSEVTTEPEERAESDSITELVKATIELSADEYYVDYPLELEDGRQVYVKIVPNLNFYPDYNSSGAGTNMQIYEEYDRLTTTLSDDELKSDVSYSIEKDYETINWMLNPQDVEWSYEIDKPENWATGIIAYSLEQIYTSAGGAREQYILYYPVDNEYQVLINICGFVGEWGSDQLFEEQQAILNFYCTEENAFVIVNPKEVEVIISDTTDVLALENYEASVESGEGHTSAPTPTEKPASTATSGEDTSHTHSWSSATCTSPMTCGCGATNGSALGHDFGGNNMTCSRCGDSNPNYTAPSPSEENLSTCSHAYGYGEINCMFCGAPHTHDWKIVVQTNSGVECTPDEDFVCHSGWYFDTFEELRVHMDIPNVHGMVYLNDGSNGVTSVPPDYTGEVAFYASCHGWANCAGDGEGERIEYEITQEVQFCKLCGVRGEATDIGERVIISHTYDD